MPTVNLDEKNRVAILEPEGRLTEQDLQIAAKKIDPLIEKAGHLDGVIICTESFPGWDSFAALVSHLRFVKSHHAKVARVAFVTDSLAGDFAEKVASHFVKAEIRLFKYLDFEPAKTWVISDAGP